MEPKKKFYEGQAQVILKEFKKRRIEGYYCNDKAEALEKVMSLIEENTTVSWGGSATLGEIGLVKALEARSLTLLDRNKTKDHAENTKVAIQALSSDYYLMSSNAITMDGKIINVDSNGNRVAALIFGPKNIIIVAGMNKVALNEEEGIIRARNTAAPINSHRMGKNTPCITANKCLNCLSEDCICSHIVITRLSKTPNRIKVILVGEELGF